MGEGLARLRRDRGVSQRELAEALGVSLGAIQRSEYGTNSMGIYQFLATLWELDATDAEILDLLRLDAKAREAV